MLDGQFYANGVVRLSKSSRAEYFNYISSTYLEKAILTHNRIHCSLMGIPIEHDTFDVEKVSFISLELSLVKLS